MATQDYFLNAKYPTNRSVMLVGNDDTLTKIDIPSFITDDSQLASIFGYSIRTVQTPVADLVEPKPMKKKKKTGKGKNVPKFEDVISPKETEQQSGFNRPSQKDQNLLDENVFTKADLIKAFGNTDNTFGPRRGGYLVKYTYS